MEVSKLAEEGIRIKGKMAVFAVNPIGRRAKNAVDAVLLLDKKITAADLNVEGTPIIFSGPGEYEVKGIKLTGISKTEGVSYIGKIDNIEVLITKASSALKTKEVLQECQIAIIDTDAVLEESLIATFTADVVILYGEHAQEVAKKLGKEPNVTAKYSVTKDKLPSEMEVVLLV